MQHPRFQKRETPETKSEYIQSLEEYLHSTEFYSTKKKNKKCIFRTEKPWISPGNYQYVNISNKNESIAVKARCLLTWTKTFKHFTKLKIGRSMYICIYSHNSCSACYLEKPTRLSKTEQGLVISI